MTEFWVDIRSFFRIFLQQHDQLIHEHGQEFIEWVHASALHPLWHSESRVLEAELRQDVVDANRFDAVARPRDETHGGLEHPRLAAEAAVVLLEDGGRVAEVLRGRLASLLSCFSFLSYIKHMEMDNKMTLCGAVVMLMSRNRKNLGLSRARNS